MKLQKFLLLGLLGICVPLTMATSCGDKPPVDNPDVVPHHPTSSFDKCPLLAHIDNPKLGIKEIRLEEYYKDTLRNEETCVYIYDKEQRVMKVISTSGVSEYKYNTKGYLEKIVGSSISSDDKWETTRIYDQYDFLVEEHFKSEYEGEIYSGLTKYRYVGDTVITDAVTNEVLNTTIYSVDMYPIYEKHEEGGGYVTETNFEWRDGNCVKINDVAYKYDNHVNIFHLTRFWNEDEGLGRVDENNKISSVSENYAAEIKYTYTDKGMVEIQQTEGSDYKYVYTYVYY